MNALIFIVLALVPVIVTAKCLNRKENDHIPKKLIVKIVVCEVIIACVAAAVENYILNNIVNNNIYTMLMCNIIGIGIVEEIAKFIPAYFLGIKSENCKTFYDIIVLCGFSTLAFAGFENILYLSDAKDLIGLGVTRGLLSITTHLMYGLIMGIFIGIAIYYKNNNKRFEYIINMVLCIIVPSIYHGVYNYSLSSKNQLAETIMIICYSIIFIYIISMISYILKNDDLEDKKMKTFGIKNLVVLLILIAIIFGTIKYKGENFDYSEAYNKIGKPIEVCDGVKITVNSVEEFFDEDETGGENYIKVNVTIMNNGQDFFGTLGIFELQKNDSEEIDQDFKRDSIDEGVDPGETISGDMYFKTEKSDKMKLDISVMDDNLNVRRYKVNLD